MSIEIQPEYQEEIEKHESGEELPYDETKRAEDFTVAKQAFLEDLRFQQIEKDQAVKKLKELKESGPDSMSHNALLGLPGELSVPMKAQADQEHKNKMRMQEKFSERADFSLEVAGLANAVLEDSFRSNPEGDPLQNAKESLAGRKNKIIERLQRAQDAGSDENAAIAAKDLRIINAAEESLESHIQSRSAKEAKREDIQRIKGNQTESPLEMELRVALERAEERAAELSTEYQQKYEELYEGDEGFEEMDKLNNLTGALQGVFARSRNVKGPAGKIGFIHTELKKLKESRGDSPEALKLIEEVQSRLS